MIAAISLTTSAGNATRDILSAIAGAVRSHPPYLRACTIAVPVPAPTQQYDLAARMNGGRFSHQRQEYLSIGCPHLSQRGFGSSRHLDQQ
jgi:hypothetical protein